MKRTIPILIVLVFSINQLQSQEKYQASFPMLGQSAPSFEAGSTQGTIRFPEDYSGKWKILFSHPADFTPVCTSEILELAAVQKEKLNTRIVVVSVDQLENHKEWLKNMETLKFKGREETKIEFPLVSDANLAISRSYGMIQPSTSSTRDVRGVFIVDPKDKIRAMFFYPMNVGRNIGEIERTLVALQTADKQEVLIPANWQPGGDVLLPYVKSDDETAKLAKKDNPDYYQLTWYMMYRKGSK